MIKYKPTTYKIEYKKCKIELKYLFLELNLKWIFKLKKILLDSTWLVFSIV